MSDEGSTWSAAFAGASVDAMEVYDRVIARLFEPWARDLIGRLDPAPGEAALDIACGPGTVTLLLAEAVGQDGRVVATDISPAMIAVGRAKDVPAGFAPIEWIESPAAPLPVPDASFDLIACQQGLQFFPDPVASLAEMRRALRPGGRAAVATWTHVSDQVFHFLYEAIRSVLGDETARRYLGPFSFYGDQATAAAAAAGFESVTAETVTLPAVIEEGFPGAFDTLVASGIAADLAALDEQTLIRLREEAARRAAPLEQDGTITSSMTATVMMLV